MEAFLQDVVNEHNGAAAANFLTPDMQWYGGTVGTVSGRANVAGLFAGVVAAFPDAHITINDIFGQGDQVVVRVVVSGTQEGPILGIPASGRHVQWDGVDIYRLSHGKISNIYGPATTGPRSSTTPARTRHPGSPEPPSAQAHAPVVLSGASVAHEDDPERAVRAGLVTLGVPGIGKSRLVFEVRTIADAEAE